MDSAAKDVYRTKGAASAVEYVTAYSEREGNELVKEWSQFFGQLFVKYRDGYKIVSDPANQACGCDVQSAPYTQSWYDRIVMDTGMRYLEPSAEGLKAGKASYVSKKSVKGVR